MFRKYVDIFIDVYLSVLVQQTNCNKIEYNKNKMKLSRGRRHQAPNGNSDFELTSYEHLEAQY